jgi:carbonic anhydrase/acetyltransferase-like protein (isoleucine patch superfamily)
MSLTEYLGALPVLGNEVFVAPTASVVGRVTLGNESSVWYGAVVRGDNDEIHIGHRTNVQDGAILHCDPGIPLEIGDDVTVGHGAIVHGCTIESQVLIGMGAVVMNRAIIGSRTILAAGALVVEDTTIPPGSLVLGVPAQIRRELTGDEVGRILTSAADYCVRARAHAAALTTRPRDADAGSLSNDRSEKR